MGYKYGDPVVTPEPVEPSGKPSRAWLWWFVALALVVAVPTSWSWYRSHQEDVQRERRVNETTCLMARDLGLRTSCP